MFKKEALREAKKLSKVNEDPVFVIKDGDEFKTHCNKNWKGSEVAVAMYKKGKLHWTKTKLSKNEYEYQHSVQAKYEYFHDEYGDATALYSDFLEAHYNNYLEYSF